MNRSFKVFSILLILTFFMNLIGGCATTDTTAATADTVTTTESVTAKTSAPAESSGDKKKTEAASESGSTTTEKSPETQTVTETAKVPAGSSSGDLSVPKTVGEFKLSKTSRISSDVVQALFKKNGDDSKKLTVTKAFGTLSPSVYIPDYKKDTLSYRTENFDGLQVVLGEENLVTRFASWSSGDFSFTVAADEGLLKNELDAFIQGIY